MHAPTDPFVVPLPADLPYAFGLQALTTHLTTLVDQHKPRGIRSPFCHCSSSLSFADMRTARTVEAGHGQIDDRVLRATITLAEYNPWPHLAQVLEITRTWTDSAGCTDTATRSAVSSLPAEVASPERLMESVRGQWEIKNGLQYRRDGTIQEDVSLLCRNALQVRQC